MENERTSTRCARFSGGGAPSGLSKVFISYRRDDAGGHAGRICDRLIQQFGRENIFFDFGSIRGGANFRATIQDAALQSGAMLAIIGPTWLTIRNEDDKRRLDDADDLVRIEVREGLKAGIPVIPVLVQGAQPPRRQHLPDDLKDLADRQAVEVRPQSFDADADQLVLELIDQIPALKAHHDRRRWTLGKAVVTACVSSIISLMTVQAVTMQVMNPEFVGIWGLLFRFTGTFLTLYLLPSLVAASVAGACLRYAPARFGIPVVLGSGLLYAALTRVFFPVAGRPVTSEVWLVEWSIAWAIGFGVCFFIAKHLLGEVVPFLRRSA